MLWVCRISFKRTILDDPPWPSYRCIRDFDDLVTGILERQTVVAGRQFKSIRTVHSCGRRQHKASIYTGRRDHGKRQRGTSSIGHCAHQFSHLLGRQQRGRYQEEKKTSENGDTHDFSLAWYPVASLPPFNELSPLWRVPGEPSALPRNCVPADIGPNRKLHSCAHRSKFHRPSSLVRGVRIAHFSQLLRAFAKHEQNVILRTFRVHAPCDAANTRGQNRAEVVQGAIGQLCKLRAENHGPKVRLRLPTILKHRGRMMLSCLTRRETLRYRRELRIGVCAY